MKLLQASVDHRLFRLQYVSRKENSICLLILCIVVLLLKVLKRDIPWEHYMSTKLISGTCLQLLRRYDHKPESQRAPLLEEVSCVVT